MKIIFWTKIDKEKGRMEFTPYNSLRVKDFVNKARSNEFKVTLEDKSPAKSENALGFWFGGIIPSIIAHDKGLVHRGQIENNPLCIRDLVRERKITQDEVEQKHRDLMFTFRPKEARDLITGETGRTGAELKQFNNTQLVALITEVLDAFEPQGYEFGDTEAYKTARNKEIDTPVLQPKYANAL